MSDQYHTAFIWQRAARGLGLRRRLGSMRKPAYLAVLGIAAAMASIASLVANQIAHTIAHRAGIETALYMDSFVRPLVQELATQPKLSPETREALERVFSAAAAGRPVLSFRLWVGDRVVFSNHRELIDRRFPPNEIRDNAWAGQVSAAFGIDSDDDAPERALEVPILEIYAPVRATGSGRIIAVAETYQVALRLKEEVWAGWLMSCAIFGGLALALIHLMFNFIDRGAREISRMNATNRRLSEMSERQMWRMRTELYDGPAQHVAVALLKLDSVRELVAHVNVGTPAQARDLDMIQDVLNDALSEIRSFSGRLLPARFTHMPLADAIRMAARKCEVRTGAEVACNIEELADDIPFSLKACLYRFVEEGLTQFREDRAGGPIVHACGGRKTVQVAIFGCLADAEKEPLLSLRQKLEGLRDRVDSLGGNFLIRSHGEKTLLIARFRISQMDHADE